MNDIELSTTHNLKCEPFFIIFIIFLLVSLVIIFKWIFPNDSEHMSLGSIDQLQAKDSQDTYLTINIEKYIPDYWGGWGKRGLWYDQYTPFMWNNATRFPSWYYPPYTYIENYYRDSYRYGYPYF